MDLKRDSRSVRRQRSSLGLGLGCAACSQCVLSRHITYVGDKMHNKQFWRVVPVQVTRAKRARTLGGRRHTAESPVVSRRRVPGFISYRFYHHNTVIGENIIRGNERRRVGAALT